MQTEERKDGDLIGASQLKGILVLAGTDHWNPKRPSSNKDTGKLPIRGKTVEGSSAKLPGKKDRKTMNLS